MSTMRFSHLLEMLQEAAKHGNPNNQRDPSPADGLAHVGFEIPKESELYKIAIDFRKYYLKNRKNYQEAVLLLERARECWDDLRSVIYLNESYYKKWLIIKNKLAPDESHTGGD